MLKVDDINVYYGSIHAIKVFLLRLSKVKSSP